MYGLANVNFCNRAQNVQYAQNLAKMFHASGQDCVVSMVSPYRNQREEFKREMGQNLLEVYVHADNDPKRPRQEDRFDGYEPPLENCLVLDTSAKTVDQCVAEIMRLIGRP
jgi:adenylylsulfate kinase-like enzyme